MEGLWDAICFPVPFTSVAHKALNVAGEIQEPVIYNLLWT
jgi:hypothetical protein